MLPPLPQSSWLAINSARPSVRPILVLVLRLLPFSGLAGPCRGSKHEGLRSQRSRLRRRLHPSALEPKGILGFRGLTGSEAEWMQQMRPQLEGQWRKHHRTSKRQHAMLPGEGAPHAAPYWRLQPHAAPPGLFSLLGGL